MSPLRKNEKHQVDDLIQSFSRGDASAGKAAVWIFILVWIALMVVDIVGRPALSKDYRVPTMRTVVGPIEPLRQMDRLRPEGDLAKMAKLPCYYQGMEGFIVPTRFTGSYDAFGFRNPIMPDGSTPTNHTIIVTGASFMEAGTANSNVFAARLAYETGLPTFNRGWSGGGPAKGMIETLKSLEKENRGTRILVYSIIQRDFNGNRMKELGRMLDDEGHLQPATTRTRLREKRDRILRWNSRMEGYYMNTSPLVKAAAGPGRFLPPLSLNLGVEARVKLGRLGDPINEPMLFYKPAVQAAYTSAEDLGEEDVTEALVKLNRYCQKKNITLVTMLVPDKYQFYLEYITELSNDLEGITRQPLPSERSPAVFARQLRKKGLHVVDLYPEMLKRQKEQLPELFYFHDDTHWNDRGIQAGAKIVAEYLEAQGLMESL